MSVATCGLLRLGEITAKHQRDFYNVDLLRGSNVTFLPSIDQPETMILRIPGSKTDKKRESVNIIIGQTGGPA